MFENRSSGPDSNNCSIRYYEILLALTTSDKEENEHFDGKLLQILQKTLPALPGITAQFVTCKSEDPNESVDVRYRYVRAIISVLKLLRACDATENNDLLNVNHFRTVKVAIELVVSIGIIPNLLPGVGIQMAHLCPRAAQLGQETIPDLQKYERLHFSTCSLIELYDCLLFKPAILSQLGPLLAALLQLSHAPLVKPSERCAAIGHEKANDTEFRMTPELYDRLREDRIQSTYTLSKLLKECSGSTSIKELMLIFGAEKAPNWLRRETRKYLIQRIMQPHGVASILRAVCDDILDLGEHWIKLDTISRLIAVSHGNSANDYYEAICPQLLELLSSKQIKYSSIIANCCITALYDYNPDICLTHIIDVICAPLLIKPNDRQGTNQIRNENEIESCVENLTKCFITVEAKFKQLRCKLLSKIAVPLFCLHNDVRQSACALKSKIEQLVLQLLYEDSLRNDLFAVFLGHDETGNFGYHVKTQFGPSGGIEIIGINDALKYEEFADSLSDLTSKKNALSTDLFTYLLTFLSSSIKFKNTGTKAVGLLNTANDAIEQFEKQLAAIKLLMSLANTSTIQEAQIKKPELLFSFIKSLFHEYIQSNQGSMGEDDCEVLYTSLMLIKMILSEQKKPSDWTSFIDFAKFLKECENLPNMPVQLSLLTREVVNLILTQGLSKGQQHYQDLSVNPETSKKFEEAVKDLADPLLPVRAHGLITLTKLIESMDPCATARKAIVLQLFQENLKHEDSFIYLAAINGMCTLATTYPKVVVETLVHEFIHIPKRFSNAEITAETRMKLGEVLVKTTRALGEMAFVYKDVLVNGFLCATRDTDPLVRASSLSCLGELCKVLGFRLGNTVAEVLYCISCTIKSDKVAECRRAAVMVATLLLRGLGKDTLTSLGRDLVDLYRGLKFLRDNDDDPVLRLHVQVAMEELDCTVQDFLFSPPKLEKRIYLLDPPT